MSKKQHITYLSPRFGILRAVITNKTQLLQIQLNLKTRHKAYFHIFNLTSFDFSSVVSSTQFKWRQIPFSITQAIKIILNIQSYLMRNNANSAIIAVPDQNCYEFALFIAQAYTQILGIQNQQFSTKGHILWEFLKIYKTISIKNPPLKIIQSLSFKNKKTQFIPISKIFTEGRYNNFDEVYMHNIENELQKYYLQKKCPLKQGIGLKYCEKKPQTKYFTKPVIVCGDVKIQIYSYTTLNLDKQFVCGFNTKALQYEQSVVQFGPMDLYEIADQKILKQIQGVQIQITDYCEKCKDQANCEQCIQIIKKINTRYIESQGELERLHRKRPLEFGHKIFA